MDILEMAVRARRTVRNANILIGGALALFVSANAVLVLIFGLAGVQGNPLVTGGYLAASELLLFCLTFRSVRLQATDYLFGGFVLSIALSFVLNVITFDPKQIALLAIALGAYPACRYLSFENPGARETFASITGAIVALGTVLAAYAMFTQWDGLYARPVVLGVTDAAAHFFLMVCGLMIFAVTASGLDRQKSLLLSAFIFLPAAVFSASHVRATFIAITATLIFALIISESKQRRYFAVVIGTLLVAIVIGQVPAYFRDRAMVERQTAREKMTGETPPPQEQPEAHPRMASRGVLVPSCTTNVKIGDSIAKRKMALQDAFKLLPAAGAFGFGFGAFDQISCVSMEVHNSYLQALIEFGWIGGLCFCAAIAIALIGLWPFFRRSNEARFAICGLVYMAMLSVPHGILGEDRMLFAILGFAVGVHERCTLKRQALHSFDTAASGDAAGSALT
ncbi:O-antigen ligase family protein [Bradyrhizobium sp. CCBAU 53338]|uniref:O-antigen ligase family protein n=1 Tax=Bradyrhizobium sp. CCBAU 53338 TaxID=1325111 RepID=UPI00188BA5DC|nr:O-antigen ligase family protein [Bradyrhizobium sp. CCBAU 53338]QOZ52018.1 hypothetical protein XH90_12070 [Bradyrhizobium sp. CCBAU 53338]